MSYIPAVFLVIVFYIGFPLTFIYGISIISYQASLPGDLAKIEQLKKDIEKTVIGNNEDVIGQVTQWNQEIQSKKRYGQTWWAGLAIPDDWDNVEIISIPKQGNCK